MTGYYKTKQERSGTLPLLLLCSKFHPDIIYVRIFKGGINPMNKQILTVILSILAIIIESMGDNE